MWRAPGSITTGEILNWRSQQSKIEIPYLWYISTGTWKLYSATDGALLANWFNEPAGTVITIAGNGPSTFGVTTSTGGIVSQAPITVGTSAATTSTATGQEVIQQAYPTVIGQDIGGAGGGGAMLYYVYGHTTGQSTGWLACWNSTLCLNAYNNNPVVISLGAVTAVNDWEFGIMWNLTIPLPSITNAIGGSARLPHGQVLSAQTRIM
jgi:hypothetical protein